jgi:hypothetical protein
MGDLLSRAPEEIAFFSRTRKTSQDNFDNRRITARVSLGSTGCQPVDLGSLPRPGNDCRGESCVQRCCRQGCRQLQAGSLCSRSPRFASKVDRLLLKMPVRLGPMAEQSPKAQMHIRRQSRNLRQRVEDNTFHLLVTFGYCKASVPDASPHGRGCGVGRTLGGGLGLGVGVGRGVAVGVGETIGVGVGVGVGPPCGAWISTVIGEPVLKKPTVAFVGFGAWSASNRKLYIVA